MPRPARRMTCARSSRPPFPRGPSSPRRSRPSPSRWGSGCVPGLRLAVALELLKHTFQTVDQAEILLGLHSLSVVPEWKRRHRDAANKGMALTGEAELPHREAFRTLRTTLAMVGGQGNALVSLHQRHPRRGQELLLLSLRQRARPERSATRCCSTPTCAAPASTSASSSSAASRA